MRVLAALVQIWTLVVLPARAGGPADLLPARIGDASASGPAEFFTGEKLFDYMNGGAELYLAYGFLDLGVRGYQQEARQIAVEVYRMGSNDDAFGIFAHGPRGEAVDLVGVPAVLARGMVSFHKGRHYLRVVARTDPDRARELLLAAGREMAARVPGDSLVPADAALLPSGASPGSLRYLPNPETARTVWFDGEGEQLLAGKARAFTALYPGPEGDVQASRVVYPSREAARKACRALAEKLSLEATETAGECAAAGPAPDQTFAVLASRDGVLRWVGGAADADSARKWLQKIK